jgi:predicted amidohydrolase YtcJ
MAMKRDQKYTDAPPGNLEKLLVTAAEGHMPAHVHAIGDQGNRILFDVFEKVLRETKLLGTDHRWRVIHAQVLDPADLARAGKLGLVAEVNPYHVADDMRWMDERIGKRSAGAYAFRTLKDSGATLVFGSDSPGTMAARYYLSPVYGLYAAVTRQTLKGEPKDGWYPAQRLTIEEALDAYIRAPAWAAFEEADKGTLEPGKLADLAVFDRDLVELGRKSPKQLLSAKVLYTITGGRVVYEARP